VVEGGHERERVNAYPLAHAHVWIAFLTRRIQSLGPIDWSEIVFDLLRAGYTVVSIAVVARVSRTTVLDWKQNRNAPRFEAGDSLLSLWVEVTGKSRESVHRLR
jgi:hypothetical protein